LPDEDEPAAVWVETEKLLPWVDNPRANDEAVDDVVASIQEFGFGAPILARRENFEIIAGHTRLKAALRLGLERVPVRFRDLTAEQAHALAISDNKTGERATWLEAGLREQMKIQLARDDAPPIAAMGFDEKSLLSLMLEGAPPVSETTEPANQLPKHPTTKKGDVWQLGAHRLICGDCRDPATLKKLGASSIAVAFTSPPYARQRKYDESSGFKPIKPENYVAWFEAVQANVRASLADDGSWFVNIKEHCDDGQRSLYVKDLTLAHVRTWGWRFVDEFSWNRPAPPGRWPDRFKNGFEPVFHFAAGRIGTFRPESVGHNSENVPKLSSVVGSNEGGPNGKYWNISDEAAPGLALPSNVVAVSGVQHGTGHSAAFPVGLPTFFVKAFSDEGDRVFDPFMGSGTTLIAAEQLQRISYGCELSRGYCDVAVERWQQLTGGRAKRGNKG